MGARKHHLSIGTNVVPGWFTAMRVWPRDEAARGGGVAAGAARWQQIAGPGRLDGRKGIRRGR